MVFDHAWFRRYQPALLYVLNHPVSKDWARHVLRIHKDCDCQLPIVAVAPNHYTTLLDIQPNGDAILQSDFRTHAKFSKRIYYAFKPFWNLIHFWDMQIANRLVPAWNMGLDTLMAWPDPDPESTTVDGPLYFSTTQLTWANIRAAASANDVRPSITGDSAFYATGGATTNYFVYNCRSIFLFSTAGLTSYATIISAQFSVAGWYKQNNLSWSDAQATLWPVSSNPASNTNIVNADYSSLGTTPFSNAGVGYSAFPTNNTYAVITLNSTGVAAISKTAVTKLGIRSGADLSDTAPGWITGYPSTSVNVYYADQAGSNYDPKLVVTFKLPQNLWWWINN